MQRSVYPWEVIADSGSAGDTGLITANLSVILDVHDFRNLLLVGVLSNVASGGSPTFALTLNPYSYFDDDLVGLGTAAAPSIALSAPTNSSAIQIAQGSDQISAGAATGTTNGVLYLPAPVPYKVRVRQTVTVATFTTKTLKWALLGRR